MNANTDVVLNAIENDSRQSENKNQYLTFILDGEEYGIDILRVQEIKGWGKVTKVPSAPSYVKGVMNLRGSIVPIIDLRSRFDLESLTYEATNVIIVLKIESDTKSRTMGVVADAVSDVYDISDENMKQPPDFGDHTNVEFLKGMATIKDKMIMLLDIDNLLTDTEIEQVETISHDDIAL